VTLTRSLGYGTYSFIVRDTSHLGVCGRFAMFTWDYTGAEQSNREMDIELSRWGDPDSENAQYVVQPFYLPANAVRFTAPSGSTHHSFRWEAGERIVPGLIVGQKPAVRHVLCRACLHVGSSFSRPSSRYGWLFMSTVPRGTLSKTGLRLSLRKFKYLP